MWVTVSSQGVRLGSKCLYLLNHVTDLWALLLRMLGACQRVTLEGPKGTSIQLLFTE